MKTTSLWLTVPAKTSITSHPASPLAKMQRMKIDMVSSELDFLMSSYGEDRPWVKQAKNNVFNAG